MKNINEICNKINYKKYYALFPELNIFTPNNKLFKIFKFNKKHNCIFIGMYNNYFVFLPIYHWLILDYINKSTTILILTNYNDSYFTKLYYNKNFNNYFISNRIIISNNLNYFQELFIEDNNTVAINKLFTDNYLKLQIQNFNTYINQINLYEKYK